MADLNWGLLSGWKNPGETFLAGVENGRARATARRQESALAAYAAHPTDNALAGILGAGDVDAYAKLSKVRDAAVETQRMGDARTTFANALRGNGGGLPAGPYSTPGIAQSPSTGALVPEGGDPDDIIVAPQRRPTTTVADVAGYDPELAGKLVKVMADMGENDRKAFAAKAEVGGSVAMQARSAKSPQERLAIIDQARPMLRQAGYTDQEVDNFDPSDANLDLMTAIPLGVKDAMAAQDRDLTRAETQRANRVREGIAGGNLGIAKARLDLSRRTEARVAKWGPRNVFGGPAAIPTDTSDLNYGD